MLYGGNNILDAGIPMRLNWGYRDRAALVLRVSGDGAWRLRGLLRWICRQWLYIRSCIVLLVSVLAGLYLPFFIRDVKAEVHPVRFTECVRVFHPANKVREKDCWNLVLSGLRCKYVYEGGGISPDAGSQYSRRGILGVETYLRSFKKFLNLVNIVFPEDVYRTLKFTDGRFVGKEVSILIGSVKPKSDTACRGLADILEIETVQKCLRPREIWVSTQLWIVYFYPSSFVQLNMGESSLGGQLVGRFLSLITSDGFIQGSASNTHGISSGIGSGFRGLCLPESGPSVIASDYDQDQPENGLYIPYPVRWLVFSLLNG
jgi:hypothetical protein